MVGDTVRVSSLASHCAGESHLVAAEIGGMQRQTLRDWVQRFNAEGPSGLLSRKPSVLRCLPAMHFVPLR